MEVNLPALPPLPSAAASPSLRLHVGAFFFFLPPFLPPKPFASIYIKKNTRGKKKGERERETPSLFSKREKRIWFLAALPGRAERQRFARWMRKAGLLHGGEGGKEHVRSSAQMRGQW